MEEIWIEAIHSEDSSQIERIRKQSIQKPNLYQQIIEEYKDRQLPQLDKLSRELHLNPKYVILQDVAETAARIFWESAEYAGIINPNRYITIEDNFVEENVIKVEDNILSLQNEHALNNQTKYNEYKYNLYKQEIGSQDENTNRNINSFSNHIHSAEGLEKYEITLINQEKAYIYVPVSLPYGEKERLKKYIDLILENSQDNSKVSNFNSPESLEQKSMGD